MLVSAITPANAGIFPEYIIPNIKHLATDPDVSVRCTYAQCIVPLTDASVRYLEMAQAMKAHGAYKFGNSDPSGLDGVSLFTLMPVFVPHPLDGKASYDSSISDLQAMIQEQLLSLLADRSGIVKRAILHNTSSLCIFFGRQKANDILLSHMITYLNDRDWLLRYAFFQSIVDVAVCVGGRSLDEYILPLMTQSLSG
jgi:phosphoinositide-3-kinase, regulatory subunit 4